MDDDMWGFSECDHYIGRGVALRFVNLSSLIPEERDSVRRSGLEIWKRTISQFEKHKQFASLQLSKYIKYI
jgi:hypothetical protein